MQLNYWQYGRFTLISFFLVPQKCTQWNYIANEDDSLKKHLWNTHWRKATQLSAMRVYTQHRNWKLLCAVLTDYVFLYNSSLEQNISLKSLCRIIIGSKAVWVISMKITERDISYFKNVEDMNLNYSRTNQACLSIIWFRE